ncbi:MAG: BatD family protein [Pseudomonadota bacterium]|nr:BatD family protein [Pseudomonadota bacterium]
MRDIVRHACVLITIAIWMMAAPAFAAPLNATIEPSQISLGQTAQLTITSPGTSMEPVTLPTVSGLEFRIIGQSRRIEIINGATLATTSVIVRVTPQTAGVFTIPGITSQPLVLRVSPDDGAGSSSPRASSGLSAKPSGGASANGLRMTADGSAFVRLVLPKRDIYVGESIPVDIELGLRSGFVTSLNGLPTLTGGDFTLNNLSHQPERVEKLIDGKPYVVLTWHSVIAAVKPGKYSLSVESPLTVKIRTRSPRDSMLDDLLGDPFLQNFFGATVSKDITVSSPPAELTVLSLPTEGRPPDFNGAVGSFEIASELSAPSAAAGDPLTLRMHVTGAGNFDRVDSSMLEHLDQWKTYPPKSSFKPSDALGHKGEKIFEQPLIASKPGTQTLPPLTFSYFDPGARRYETARSAPLRVTISPSAADSSFTAPQAPLTAATPAGNSAAPTSEGLRPDHAITGGAADSLVPLYLEPRFLVLPSLLALGFVGAWLRQRRAAAGTGGTRRIREHASSKAAARVLKDLRAAARAADAARFFNLARTALLQTLAVRWHVAPDRMTPDELQARLAGESEETRQLFALADEANYSGHPPTGTDFERWMRFVSDRLMEQPRPRDGERSQSAPAPGSALVLPLTLVIGLGAGLMACPTRAQPIPASIQSAPAATAPAAATPNPSHPTAPAAATPNPSHPAAPAATAPDPSHPMAPGYSASALYNLGNAYARAGRPALAVLNYQRASLLAPYDPDIDANLRQVRDAMHLPPEPQHRFRRALSVAGPTVLSWMGVVGIVMMGAGLLAPPASFPQRWKRLRQWAAGIGFGCGFALVALTVGNAVMLWPTLHAAVVLTAAAPARVSPVPMGDPLFVLPEAETVRMTAQREDFVLVQTRTGRTGWVSRADLAPVVPR